MIIRFLVHVLPLPLFTGMWLLWLLRTSNQWFSFYVMILPLLYGYLVPGIATTVLKKWEFHGPHLLGNIYPHHGFIYASNMSTLLFLAFGIQSHDVPLNLGTGLPIVAGTGALHGFVLWIRDTLILRAGMVEIHSPFAAAQKSAEEISFCYAPLTFFTLGITYAMVCVLAYNELVINKHTNGPTMAWLIAAGLLAMILCSSVAYGMVENKHASRKGKGA